MTNPLEILKTQLEKALDETSETEDFKEALRDAINACNLNSVAALEEWVFSWAGEENLTKIYGESDYQYLRGVFLVEEKWHAITGMF